MLEVGRGDDDEDVDDVFADELGDCGAAYVVDGEVGDACAREVGGELFFYLLEGGGPGFLVGVDPDFHAGGAWG